MSLIPTETTPQALHMIAALARIALKAHHNNPSPVDIKEELAALDVTMLIQLEEDATRILNSQKPTA